VAFIAPESYLKDSDEKERWRIDGAHMLGRAAELSRRPVGHRVGGPRRRPLPEPCPARLTRRSGFLERTMVATDDDELRDKARAHLEHLLGTHFEDLVRAKQERERLELLRRLENGVWSLRHTRTCPSAPLAFDTMVMGPPRAPARCAGFGAWPRPLCASTWREWEARSEAERWTARWRNAPGRGAWIAGTLLALPARRRRSWRSL